MNTIYRLCFLVVLMFTTSAAAQDLIPNRAEAPIRPVQDIIDQRYKLIQIESGQANAILTEKQKGRLHPFFQAVVAQHVLDIAPRDVSTDQDLPSGVSLSPRGEMLFDAIIYADDPEGLRIYGIPVNAVVGTIATARITAEQASVLSNIAEVSYVDPGNISYPETSISLHEMGVHYLHGGYINDTEYRGEGAIVVVFDTGVDWRHPDFLDQNDPTKTRILYLWDVTLEAEGLEKGFGDELGWSDPYGVEYTKEHIETALKGTGSIRSNDVNGHGTHVLGIIAGNGDQFTGIAPGADIIVIRGGVHSFSLANIINGLVYAQKRAADLGKPVVVNCSFGGHFGAHDGTRADEIVIDQLSQDPGYVVVTSAGNYGSSYMHTSGTVRGDEKDIIRIYGPGGVTFILPEEAPVTLHEHSAEDILRTGEQAASATVRVDIGDKAFIRGAPDEERNLPVYELRFPITLDNIEPERLRLRVRVADDVLLPVVDRYDPETQTYIVTTFGLTHGWVMGVVAGDPVTTINSSHMGKSSIDETQKDSDPWQWPTLDVTIIDEEEKHFSQSDLEYHILPIARDVLITLQSSGFIAPAWKVDNDHGGYQLYLQDKGELSYYQGDANLLGRVYIDYLQYITYADGSVRPPSAWKLNNVIAHEVFHAVQYGYAFGEVKVHSDHFNREAGSAVAYVEGTASLVGGTYDSKRHIGIGSATIDAYNIIPRHNLGNPVDDFNIDPYSKQDFFAFMAKRYFNGSLHHLNSLFNLLWLYTTDSADLSEAELYVRYREGMDGFLGIHDYSLPYAYTEYSLQRLYLHEPEYLLTRYQDDEKDDPQFKINTLAKGLLTQGKSYFDWSSKENHELAYDPLVFSNIRPLSSAAATLDIPTELPEDIETIPINITMSNGQVNSVMDQEGIRILIMRERHGEPVSSNAAVVVSDIDDPVEISLYEGTEEVTHLRIIVINAYVQDVNVNVIMTVVSGETILTITPPHFPGRNSQEYTFILTAEEIPAGIEQVRFEWDFGDSRTNSKGTSQSIPVIDGKAEFFISHSYIFDDQLEDYSDPPKRYNISASMKDFLTNNELADARATFVMVFPLEGKWDVHRTWVDDEGNPMESNEPWRIGYWEQFDWSTWESWGYFFEIVPATEGVEWGVSVFGIKEMNDVSFLLMSGSETFQGSFTDKDNFNAVWTRNNRQVSWSASRLDYTIIVHSDPTAGGQVSINDRPLGIYESLTVERESQVTLQAKESIGYTFDGWYDGNIRVTISKTYEFNASENKTYIAKFTQQMQE